MRLVSWSISLGVLVIPALSVATTSIELSDLAVVTGATEGTLATTGLAQIGDVNGDGYEDVALGAPDAGDESQGAVYILYGQADRIDQVVFADLPTLVGEEAGDQLGSVVAGLGDINADSYDDFALTSQYHDTGENNPGTVYLIYGQATAYTNQTVASRPRWYGADNNDHAGVSLAGVGDINSDSYDDWAVGATWHDDRSGGIYVLYGQATAFTGTQQLSDQPFFSGSDDFDYAGSAIAAGDVTGDGVSDIVVSAPRYDGTERDVGTVYTIPGRTTAYNSTNLDTFTSVSGATKRERIGTSLAVGDVTGDNVNDIIVGVPYSDTAGDNAGVVYVNSTATTITGGTTGDLFGKSLAWLGDVTGDGANDLLIGAPSELDPQAGFGWLHSTLADYQLAGEVVGDLAGAVVAGADLNGDGQTELLIAAPHYDGNRGRLYIGYWPIYTCANSVELGGLLADYPSTDYKLRNYAANSHFKIAVERRGQQAFLINCNANRIEQTLTFNTRTQRKILARVFRARGANLFIAVTRTPSKRKIKIFLYQQTESALVETDYLKRKWRPRGFRIKLNHHNKVVLQKGQERKHRLRYRVRLDLTLNPLD
ncbi:MAG: FG-GAP repeat protein [Candidatus Kerfeldbacteria bacterium]|nr:FG-GAP repeat protein [Candidatus Kerfeldbacteria bacterium]